MAALDLIGEYDARGRAIHETVYLGDLPVAVLDGTNCFGEGRTSTNIHYVSTDNLGAPHIITDERGKKVWQWNHAPFGDTKPTEAAGFTYDLRFPGQIADAESGLSNNMHRDYNSTLGRYAQSDPLGLFADVNTYGYVGQNPITRVDPKGLLYVLFGGGGSAHIVLVGGGSSTSLGFDTNGNACIVTQVCGTFGIGVSGGVGLNGGIGTGSLCDGTSHSGGVFVDGGAGVYGGGSITTTTNGGGFDPGGMSPVPASPGDKSYAGGTGTFGFGAGGAGGFIGCTQHTSCVNIPNILGF